MTVPCSIFFPKYVNWENASAEGSRSGTRFIGTEHLLIALINQRDAVGTRLLESEGVMISELKAEIAAYLGSSPYRSTSNQRTSEEEGKKAKKSPLSQFGKDLTALAAEGKTDPVIGRENETEKGLVISLRVAEDDMGKVIGKQGRIAKAIRTVTKAAASKEDKKVMVEIQQ